MATSKCWGDWIVGGGCRRWGVVTVRRFIYFVRNQRTEVYSLFPTWRRDGEQGRTRDTSIMTCPMSPSKRALLPRREVAVTVRYQRARKKLSIFWWERVKAEARNTPRWRDRRHRACREGSWEGGGVLAALGTASCLVEDTTCQRDGNVIVVASFLVAGGSIFNL
jgi:hypothetical protein